MTTEQPLGATEHEQHEAGEQVYCLCCCRTEAEHNSKGQCPQTSYFTPNLLSAAPTPTPDSERAGGSEAVAWQRRHPVQGWIDCREEDAEHYRKQGQAVRPLYTRPAPERAGGWQQERVEAGKVAVPIQPTEAMIAAGDKAAGTWHVDTGNLDGDGAAVWAAMLAALAQPTGEQP